MKVIIFDGFLRQRDHMYQPLCTTRGSCRLSRRSIQQQLSMVRETAMLIAFCISFFVDVAL